RLKIESCKKYPDSARARHVEGRTVIRFVIEPDGRVSSLSVIKSSRNRALDNAAKDAVRAASPFLKPPANLFKDKLLLELTILFELA
ncbi:MAG: energy transducer TonB, partial [Deltaproteobacteria bacterium]